VSARNDLTSRIFGRLTVASFSSTTWDWKSKWEWPLFMWERGLLCFLQTCCVAELKVVDAYERKHLRSHALKRPRNLASYTVMPETEIKLLPTIVG